MKRFILYILVFAVCFSFAPTAYAEDVATIPTEFDVETYISAFLEQDMSPMLFALDQPPKLDFAKIGNKLTIEVKNYNDSSVLLVGEYSANDTLIKAHIIENVEAENYLETSGEYEEIFLWELPELIPQCASISTKCDYEIVEAANVDDWVVSANGHLLHSYIGDDTDVVIPNSYKGKRIYGIQNVIDNTHNEISEIHHYNIFNGRKDITSVKISEGIQVIGNFAFAYCGNMTGEISIPKTTYSIGAFAYYNCSGLTGSLNLSGLRSLQPYTFYGCSGLNGELVLPAVAEIGEGIFSACSGLNGPLNIPEGVNAIGDYAFMCDAAGGFTSLNLPSTLKKIGTLAFQKQTKISNAITLPKGLEYIGDFAFNHCSMISNSTLNIPASLKTIGGDYGVDENTDYGSHVFYDSFKKVTAFNVDSESQAFASVDGVLYSKDMNRLVAYPPAKTDTAFIVPNGVTQFDEMSFGYSKITDLTLPDSYKITQVPENVLNKTGNSLAVALYHNNKIVNVLTNDSNPNYKSIDGIVYSKNGKSLWYVPTHKTGTITVADGTERIEMGAFYVESASNPEAYTGITIPATVNYIDEYCLKAINLKMAKNITVDADNPNYKLDDNGKLVKKQ